MKTIAIILSIAALFASAAVSAQETYAGHTGFVSTKTRAEVKAETLAAIKRGELRDGEQYPNPVVGQSFSTTTATKTRAEVKAELAAYRKTNQSLSAEIPAS